MTVALSVLDLVLTSEGDTPAETLANSLELARVTDALGYRRYWLAEHHFYADGAGAASYILAPLIAERTKAIRVGTAVLVIDNYSPVHVAEIAGTCAALTGRGFDLGIGRGGPSAEQVAKGRITSAKLASGELTAGPTSEFREVDGVTIPPFVTAPFNADRAELNDRLLSRTPGDPADFGGQVDDVLGFLDGSYQPLEGDTLDVAPARGADVELWVHGSTPGISAEVAGRRGLRFGANYHNFPQLVLETVAAYRAAFVPSAELAEPYVAVSADVLVAATDELAEELGAGFRPWMYSSRLEYAARPYLSPASAAAFPWNDEREAIVADRVAARIVGSPSTVVARLRALARATGADELVITTSAYDPADKQESYRLLAEAWAAE
ncbi:MULTISPECIES: LLM class flavin-dependent oxidoreductase [Subtercola]|uniref:LLM class flavin-dependent oxidoreductase n=1 Tax=Subtercola vilae TaxID=2056433 RepID=A0A4T2BT32_9MICO|nr:MULTISPECIES: LLM class flavin-dependent oxidoreductase [Subtercola]MEA9985596.1 LLM class flavin-dependent oxidoreductase [Subtercola sp. RTI3]TIH34825.1 LLM class flavin-dependent oxidoreductase [Subtercola vilae]